MDYIAYSELKLTLNVLTENNQSGQTGDRKQ